MNTLEDRVRAATRAAADTVSADGVPSLRLPSADPAEAGRWHAWFSTPWAHRLAPLAAAVAVGAVAIAMVFVGRSLHEPASSSGSGVTPVGPMTAGPPVSSYVGSGQVPPYYVSIESRGNPNFNPSYAVVRATVTGRALATIRASVAHGTVVAVTAAADDRTFVLDEQPWASPNTNANQGFEPRSFYLVRLGASGRPGQPTRLPLTVPGGQMVTGFALSPDGSELAIAVEPDNIEKQPDLQQVRVYALTTGAVRTWSADGTIGFGPDDARSLSWADDERTLAFFWAAAGPGAHTSVRLLDTGTGGGNLLADSRQAVSLVNEPLPSLMPTMVSSPTASRYESAPAASGGSVSAPATEGTSAPAAGAISAAAAGAASAPAAGATSAPGPTPTPTSPSGSAPAVASVGPTPEPSSAGLPISLSGRAAPSLACQEDAIITPDGSLVVCGATEMVNVIQTTGHGPFTSLGEVETGFVEYSTAAGKITHILGHWKFNHEAPGSVEVLWSNATGSVLIGVIPSADGYGRVGVISGNEFTPLPAQAAPVLPDSGTW